MSSQFYSERVVVNVTCAIIEQHARVLVTQRSEQMEAPMLWEFPGGKIEAGETEEECLIREIKEELSLEIQPLKRLTPVVHALGEARSLKLIPYICRYKGGTIQLLEHRGYQWAAPQDLMKYAWCEPDVPVVAEYLRLLALQ